MTPATALEELLSVCDTCDSLELERIINAMRTALRFAQDRSHNGTLVDQRLYRQRHEQENGK